MLAWESSGAWWASVFFIHTLPKAWPEPCFSAEPGSGAGNRRLAGMGDGGTDP